MKVGSTIRLYSEIGISVWLYFLAEACNLPCRENPGKSIKTINEEHQRYFQFKVEED